jgi:outer membrane protein assembly factor BamA
MSYAPVPQGIERTRERIAEIDYELLSMQVKEDTETEDPTEQVELIVVQGRRAAR